MNNEGSLTRAHSGVASCVLDGKGNIVAGNEKLTSTGSDSISSQ